MTRADERTFEIFRISGNDDAAIVVRPNLPIAQGVHALAPTQEPVWEQGEGGHTRGASENLQKRSISQQEADAVFYAALALAAQ